MSISVQKPKSRKFPLFLTAVTATVAVMAGFLINSPATEAATSTVGYLKTSGNKILTSSGKEHTIKAISWFGMETSNCSPHGTWTISLDSGLKTIADNGFNTIRLPYANECFTKTPSGIDFNKNPQLANKSSLQVMDYFIERAGAYGLSVILDRHRPDVNSQSALWYTSQVSEQKWIDDWVMLANRYKNNTTVIGADLHNEPHGEACWGCGDTAKDWSIAAKKAGDKVLAANPNWLIIVEGVERSQDGTNYWWGGNLKDVAKKQITLNVPNRLVYSTHDYPSTIYNQQWFNASNYPNNLPTVWDNTWGYIHKQNIAPVLVGEFGTKYETDSDKKWLTTLVSYMKTNKMSFAFWSFNPNSGDTGGIVKDDWTTLQTAKLEALKPILNPSSTVTPTPTPTQTVVPSPTPTKTATPTPTPTKTVTPTPTPTVQPPTNGKTTGQYFLQSSWAEGYVAEIVIKTPAPGTASTWTVSWSDPNATSVVNSWGTKCSINNKIVTCTADGYGSQNLQWGNEVRVGVQLTTKGAAPTNPTLTVK